MARGSAIGYVGASIVTPLILYEIFLLTGWTAALGLAVLGVSALILVLLFAMPVGIAIWVYQDAQDRGWNGAFWAVVSIFVPFPFGAAIYALARSERRFKARGAVWYVLYGMVMPVTLLAVSLYTGWGGILVVIGALLWMGFALAMAAPSTQPQTP